MMLAAIAVFAVVGGAYAVKANRGQQVIYYGTASSLCTNPTVATLSASGNLLRTTFATTEFGAICTTRPIYLGN